LKYAKSKGWKLHKCYTFFHLRIHFDLEKEYKQAFNEAVDKHFSRIGIDEAEFKQKHGLKKK
jgi:hypothetical protein